MTKESYQHFPKSLCTNNLRCSETHKVYQYKLTIVLTVSTNKSEIFKPGLLSGTFPYRYRNNHDSDKVSFLFNSPIFNKGKRRSSLTVCVFSFVFSFLTDATLKIFNRDCRMKPGTGKLNVNNNYVLILVCAVLDMSSIQCLFVMSCLCFLYVLSCLVLSIIIAIVRFRIFSY